MGRKSILNAFLILVLFITSGCGTLFTGSSDLVSITSEPAKAKVYVDGMYIGTSPATTSLKRDKDHSIVVKKEGYEDASANISRSFNAVSILNLLSPICWIVDIVTGGMWKFDRNGITVQMDPIVKTTNINGPVINPGKDMKVMKLDSGKTAVYAN